MPDHPGGSSRPLLGLLAPLLAVLLSSLRCSREIRAPDAPYRVAEPDAQRRLVLCFDQCCTVLSTVRF